MAKNAPYVPVLNSFLAGCNSFIKSNRTMFPKNLRASIYDLAQYISCKYSKLGLIDRIANVSQFLKYHYYHSSNG